MCVGDDMSNAENLDPAEDDELEEPDDPLDLSKAWLSMTFVGVVIVGVLALIKFLA